MIERPSVDDTLLKIAETWAERSTCARMHVGAVLAREGRVITSGYNGAPTGMAHCACQPEDYLTATATCPVSVHAEANAVAFAARFGIATAGATLYSTLTPCLFCARLIVNAGVVRVVALREYQPPHGELNDGLRLLFNARIPLELRNAP